MSDYTITQTEAGFVEAITRAVLTGTTQEAADAFYAYREWLRADERQQARQRVWVLGEPLCTCGSNVRLGQHCYCEAAQPYRDAAAAAGGDA